MSLIPRDSNPRPSPSPTGSPESSNRALNDSRWGVTNSLSIGTAAPSFGGFLNWRSRVSVSKVPPAFEDGPGGPEPSGIAADFTGVGAAASSVRRCVRSGLEQKHQRCCDRVNAVTFRLPRHNMGAYTIGRGVELRLDPAGDARKLRLKLSNAPPRRVALVLLCNNDDLHDVHDAQRSSPCLAVTPGRRGPILRETSSRQGLSGNLQASGPEMVRHDDSPLSYS